MFVLFEFLDSLLYVHLFIAPEGYDEGILEFCQDLFSRTVDLVVVGRGTIGVFVQSAFHIIFDRSKSFQSAVIRFQPGGGGENLNLEYRCIRGRLRLRRNRSRRFRSLFWFCPGFGFFADILCREVVAVNYILGLDIGITSVGWCVLDMDKEKI